MATLLDLLNQYYIRLTVYILCVATLLFGPILLSDRLTSKVSGIVQQVNLVVCMVFAFVLVIIYIRHPTELIKTYLIRLGRTR